jgi:hypothetical protein
MANGLYCSVEAYNKAERGVRTLRIGDFEFLYSMGCNLNWLFTGEESMNVGESEPDNDLIKSLTKSNENSTEANLVNARSVDKLAETIKTMSSNCAKQKNISSFDIENNNENVNINSANSKQGVSK